jgi:hypothetical protein
MSLLQVHTPKRRPLPPSELTPTRATASSPPDASSRSMYQSPPRQSVPVKTQSLPVKSGKKIQNRKNRLYFESPRCEFADKELFLPADRAALMQKDHDERWKFLQEQAGQHQQDGTFQYVDVKKKSMTPAALKSGMPLQAAARVLSLHLELDERDDRLPAWLDVITAVYFNLESLSVGRASTTSAAAAGDDVSLQSHSQSPGGTITTTSTSSDNDNNDNDDGQELNPSASSPKISNRMRRLYILYRLPDLLTIDGTPVTAQERLLARPNHPNGERVKREEWVESSCLLDLDRADDDDCDEHDHELGEYMDDDESDGEADALSPNFGGAVEVDLHGGVKLVEAKIETTAMTRLARKNGNGAPGHVTDEDEDNYNAGMQEDRQEESSGPQMPELTGLDDLRSSNNDDYKMDYQASSDNGSDAVCEWSAACGSLSLPYFRADSRRRLTAAAAKPRTRLFGRKNKEEVVAKQEEVVNVEMEDLTLQKKEEEVQEEPVKAQSPYPGPPLVTSTQEKAVSASLIPLIHSSSSSSSSQETEIEIDVGSAHGAVVETVEPPVLPRIEVKEFPPTPRHSSVLQRTLEKTVPATRNSGLLPPSSLPPSKSLSSPFPIQFRARTKIGQSPSRQLLSISTKLNSEGDGLPAPPPVLRQCDFEMETIESPIELIRVQSSPSKLSQSRPTNKGGLPPPCPGGRRTPPVVKGKKKRGYAKWREKLSARSSSIIDEDESDDGDDDGDNEEEEDNSQDTSFSSDEENVVVEG